MSATQKEDHGRNQAAAQYESICEMVEALKMATDDDAFAEAAESLAKAAGFSVTEDMPDVWRYHKHGETADPDGDFSSSEEEAWLVCCEDNGLRPSEDDARQAIQEDALSVEVSSGWYTPGSDHEPEEFNILLCTGGPACRIRGELGQWKEPDRAWLEYQDWGTPWTEYFDADQDTLLAYAREFYFGE